MRNNDHDDEAMYSNVHNVIKLYVGHIYWSNIWDELKRIPLVA